MGEISFDNIFNRINELRNLYGEIRENEINNITTLVRRLCSDTGTGKLYIKKKERPKKSYSSDSGRVTQFLRHIARVLYFEVNEDLNKKFTDEMMKDKILVEVQVLLAKSPPRSSPTKMDLFFAFNARPHDDYHEHFKQIKSSLETRIRELHNEIREHSPTRKVGDNRVYSLYKLKKHLENESCKQIYELLLDMTHCHVLPQNITSHPIDRHAEETLCDKAKEIRKNQNNMVFQIQGKMRPCKSCAGRMKDLGFINYNKKSGFLFLDCLKRQLQERNYEAAIASLKLLNVVPCYCSISEHSNPYNFDTESDSENESDHSSFIAKFEKSRDHRKRAKPEGSISNPDEIQEPKRQQRQEEKRKDNIKKGRRSGDYE